MTAKNRHVYCFVPECKNTIRSTPDKLFFNVPTGSVRRNWCQIVRRDMIPLIGTYYCCEDHFSLEEDVEEWMRYKIMKAAGQKVFRLSLKKNVVPHIFDCQRDRRPNHFEPVRSVIPMRQSIAAVRSIEELIDAGFLNTIMGEELVRPEDKQPSQGVES